MPLANFINPSKEIIFYYEFDTVFHKLKQETANFAVKNSEDAAKSYRNIAITDDEKEFVEAFVYSAIHQLFNSCIYGSIGINKSMFVSEDKEWNNPNQAGNTIKATNASGFSLVDFGGYNTNTIYRMEELILQGLESYLLYEWYRVCKIDDVSKLKKSIFDLTLTQLTFLLYDLLKPAI